MSAISGGSVKREPGLNNNNNNNRKSKSSNNNSGLPSFNDLLWSDDGVDGDVMAQGLGGVMVRLS